MTSTGYIQTCPETNKLSVALFWTSRRLLNLGKL
jgi:hypothetical protein